MFNIFSNYKKSNNEKNELMIENIRLKLDLGKYGDADRALVKVFDYKFDLSELDLRTKGQIKEASNNARQILNNPLFKHIIDNLRYNLIMTTVKESRDYPEVVQKRANLLMIENVILKEFNKFANMSDEILPDDSNSNDFDFINN